MNEGKNMQLEVRLGERTYPIRIGSGSANTLLEESDRYLSQGRKVVAVFDEGLVEANPDFCSKLRAEVPCFSTPSGESTKSLDWLGRLWGFLSEQKVDRSSVLFAVGGGVTGDLAGFAAASYLRGISFYQVPTTLLAMVDSSVGGKTGINLSSGKNLVGAFHQPTGVFVDVDCLRTLPPREFSAGMAEIIKYGMLGNLSLYQQLVERTVPLSASSPELDEIILCCCSDKARIVEQDEKETSGGSGGRALLNLGHTFAHAIEAVSGYGSYLHGEAVAIGLVCALRLSRIQGGCQDHDEEVLIELLRSYELPFALEKNLSLADLMNVMGSDKKVVAGKLRFVLMQEIGVSQVVGEVDAAEVERVWKSVGVG
jgi:3-dehydroquinate synthase